MKKYKLFLIISFTLLLFANIFGQAAVDIPLSATDGTYTIPLAIGLDTAATIGIDPQLGESDLPPFPPIGAFEIRFDLQPYTGQPLSSYKDYRYGTTWWWGQVQYTLWWQTSASYPLPIIMQYEILNNGSFMRLIDYIGGSFLNLGPFSGSGTAIIPETYTMIFNKCLLVMEYNTLVPIELKSFTATVSDEDVQLNWTTATETNNSGFEILRFTQNDNEWITIGFVPGFGTTTEPKSYSFTDENVSTGTYKYRLKQIDFDGSFTYSNELEVEVDFTPKEFVLYQNFPNPFNPSTTIKYSLPVESQVRINIYNALGEVIEELVSEMQNYGTYEIIWNAQNYSSGIYYYSFEVNSADGSQSHREMKKIVFLK